MCCGFIIRADLKESSYRLDDAVGYQAIEDALSAPPGEGSASQPTPAPRSTWARTLP